MNDFIDGLFAECEAKNFPVPVHLPGWRWEQGDKAMELAVPAVRELAQNLIDRFDRHGHLREAQVLLLMVSGKKADGDGRLELGKARKANNLLQFLSNAGSQPCVDFLVELNIDQWPDLSDRQKAALLDHELTHCGVTIGGTILAEGKVQAFVNRLGEDHIDSCDMGEGKTLVRYRKRKGKAKPGTEAYGEQPLVYRIRKHDIEEFVEVWGQWGAYTKTHQRVVHCMEKLDIDQTDTRTGENERERNAG